MDDLFPNLFRSVSALLSRYGLIALIPLLGLIIWVAFPRGSLRLGAVIVVAVFVLVFFFADHPAISPLFSAMGAALYHFRSMLR